MTTPTRALGFILCVLCLLFVAVAPANAQTLTINEARNQGVDATVTVEGTVARAFGAFVRFQDGSGPTGASGLVVRQTSGAFRDSVAAGAIQPGTQLQVSGTLSEFRGLLQINNADLSNFSIQGQGTVPAPQDVSVGELQTNGEDYESELIRVAGLDIVKARGTFEQGTSYPVTDGTAAETLAGSTVTFRVQGGDETTVIGANIPGGVFEYTGVVGEFRGQYQLIPVRSSDAQPVRSFGFTQQFVQAEEGSGTVTVDVKAFATESSDNVSVTATLGGGSTADAGDVGGFSGTETLNFSGSDPAPQTLSFDPVDDGTDEGVERLEVVLASSDGAIARPRRFTLWVLDAPAVQSPIAAGDSGDALIDSLQQQFADPRPLGDDFARDSMYAVVYNEADTVEGQYSGFQITVDPRQGDPSTIAANKGINNEHTWPQSKGAGAEPATSDLHILVPARQEVNSARCNYPYAEIADSTTERWFRNDMVQTQPPSSNRGTYSESVGNDCGNPSPDGQFEPRHSVKGDVARAAFYFVTTYPNRADFTFFDEQKETLLDWHEQDPVDATEMRRTLIRASYQDNVANPFVLDSTLADRAYGTGAGTGEPTPPSGTFELYADEAELTPSGGQADAQCLVQRSTGEIIFFNSDDGGIFSWDGSSLSEERASGDVNSDIASETSTIDRCDGVTVDANDNAYFLLRANGSSSTNSWPTFVYKLSVSGSPAVLANEDGIQGAAHDSGTLYLAGVSFRGAPADGVFSIDDSGEGQSLTEVVSNSNLDLNYGMDVDERGDVYAFSGGFGGGNFVRKIVRVTDPSGSPAIEAFANPYRSGSPLIADSGNDISDLRIISFGGTEYIVVYNGSFQAQDGDQWATIQLSDQSIELLFNRTELVGNLPADDYVSAFTRPMTVNSQGEVFAASRTLNSATEYIARVSNAPPLPVEMVGFDAVQTGSSVELTWQTASETNSAGFQVQRKSGWEGAEWTQIGFREGAGTTEATQTYRFTDAHPPFEADALTYRLKQVDLDGSASFSAPVTLRQTVDQVTLRAPYPNPVRDRATVPFALPERQDVSLRLYDVLGRRVRTLVDGTYEGRQEAPVDLSDLSSGVYFLRLEAGGQVQTRRMTVVR